MEVNASTSLQHVHVSTALNENGRSRGEHEITTCACLCSVHVYEEDRKGRRMGGWTEAGIEQEVKMQKEKQ